MERVFGEQVEVQRCQIHKRLRVKEYLPGILPERLRPAEAQCLRAFLPPNQLSNRGSSIRPTEANRSRFSTLARLKPESQLLADTTDAIVKTEEFHIGDSGANDQRRCQVNRIQGTHRLDRKRAPCALNNVQTKSIDVPVCSGSIEVRPATYGRGFVDLPERDRADQYAITLNQHEVGCEHEFRTAERFSDPVASCFPE